MERYVSISRRDRRGSSVGMRHQASETPNEPACIMGDGKNGRPGSKCNCCFEAHGSRSGMVQSVLDSSDKGGQGKCGEVSGSVNKRW
jgi:hypothetical protein